VYGTAGARSLAPMASWEGPPRSPVGSTAGHTAGPTAGAGEVRAAELHAAVVTVAAPSVAEPAAGPSTRDEPRAPVGAGVGEQPRVPGRAVHLPYNPALDGLRGVAVAVVMLFHSGFSWARGGYLGVSTFFTLSGFLITTLLLRERADRGRVDLPRFWARRVRRLLPASALTLVAVAVWALVADQSWERNLRGDELAALFQVANWRFLVDDRSYADLFAAPSPLLHFWSLAIEEQFYWLFPALVAGVLALAHGSRRALGGTVAGLFATSAVLTLALGADHRDAVYYATPVRVGEVLAGALLAVVLAGRGPLRPGTATARAAAVGGVAGLAASGWAWATVGQATAGLYRGGLLIYAVATSAVVLAATVPGPVRRALAWTPLRLLGVISYGVYLAHWPIFLWLDEHRTGWSGAPLLAVRVAATLAVAVASYVLLERPVRAGWRPPRLPMPALAGVTLAGVAVIAAVVPAVSRPPADPFAAAAGGGAVGGAADESPADPDLRPLSPAEIPDGDLLAVSLGDSTMLNTVIGLRRWGLKDEDRLVTVAGLGGLGCAIARQGERSFLGDEGVAAPYCDWTDRVARDVATVRSTYGGADVALIAPAVWDVVDRRLPGDDAWRAPGDPVFDANLRRELAAATDAFLALGLPVVWLTMPHLDIGRAAQPRLPEPPPESEPARVDRVNKLVAEVVAERGGSVALVDIGGYIDGLPDGEDERLRPDGVHLERDAAEEVADWLGPQIRDATATLRDR
jgi:peptidoglycan/LPS O-acetylase OafA/YrhL